VAQASRCPTCGGAASRLAVTTPARLIPETVSHQPSCCDTDRRGRRMGDGYRINCRRIASTGPSFSGCPVSTSRPPTADATIVSGLRFTAQAWISRLRFGATFAGRRPDFERLAFVGGRRLPAVRCCGVRNLICAAADFAGTALCSGADICFPSRLDR